MDTDTRRPTTRVRLRPGSRNDCDTRGTGYRMSDPNDPGRLESNMGDGGGVDTPDWSGERGPDVALGYVSGHRVPEEEAQ